jgi:hypothetical protein
VALGAAMCAEGAGRTDDKFVEMIARPAQFLLWELMNNAAETPIDFPTVEVDKAG